ncbi:MAG: 3-oxoacid CoA-transferase subunit B [Segniliparus sp.]|uniref:3-oxoacid CoA-transferase subunit B n=1 Tax=Segniliparus sp. TaxID=2804064 RepID=UPI003F3DEB76
MTNTEPLARADLARLVARDIPRGAYVNLGIGQPTAVGNYLAPEQQVTLHTENGMLGMGPAPAPGDVDPDLINAGKAPVTELPGASYFHHADSFAMMRGGHLDVCVLGAFQVSTSGDLANWATSERDSIPAVGGAMDLAIGAKQVFVMMTLFGRDNKPKLVPICDYPLTAVSCVARVYSDRGVFEITSNGVVLHEAFGTTAAELEEALGIPLLTPPAGGRKLSSQHNR